MLNANPLGLPIGSQTYPHRAMIKDGNFAGLPKNLADIGVQSVEMCSPLGYAEFAPLADGKQVEEDPRRPRPEVRERALQHAGAAGETGREHRLGARTSASRR